MLEQDELDNIIALLESAIYSIEKFQSTSSSTLFAANTTAEIPTTAPTGGIVVSSIQNLFLEELFLIHQTSTVDNFHQQFEALQTRVLFEQPGLPEEFFTSLFLNGLHKDVHTYVQSFHPVTVIDAFDLACIYEYSLRAAARTTETLVQTDDALCIPADSTLGTLAHDTCPCESANNDILEDRPRGMDFCASGSHIVVAVSEGDKNLVEQNVEELTIATKVGVIADRFVDALNAVDGDVGATHLPCQLGSESVTNSAMIVRSFTDFGKMDAAAMLYAADIDDASSSVAASYVAHGVRDVGMLAWVASLGVHITAGLLGDMFIRGAQLDYSIMIVNSYFSGSSGWPPPAMVFASFISWDQYGWTAILDELYQFLKLTVCYIPTVTLVLKTTFHHQVFTEMNFRDYTSSTPADTLKANKYSVAEPQVLTNSLIAANFSEEGSLGPIFQTQLPTGQVLATKNIGTVAVSTFGLLTSRSITKLSFHELNTIAADVVLCSLKRTSVLWFLQFLLWELSVMLEDANLSLRFNSRELEIPSYSTEALGTDIIFRGVDYCVGGIQLHPVCCCYCLLFLPMTGFLRFVLYTSLLKGADWVRFNGLGFRYQSAATHMPISGMSRISLDSRLAAANYRLHSWEGRVGSYQLQDILVRFQVFPIPVGIYLTSNFDASIRVSAEFWWIKLLMASTESDRASSLTKPPECHWTLPPLSIRLQEGLHTYLILRFFSNDCDLLMQLVLWVGFISVSYPKLNPLSINLFSQFTVTMGHYRNSPARVLLHSVCFFYANSHGDYGQYLVSLFIMDVLMLLLSQRVQQFDLFLSVTPFANATSFRVENGVSLVVLVHNSVCNFSHAVHVQTWIANSSIFSSITNTDVHQESPSSRPNKFRIRVRDSTFHFSDVWSCIPGMNYRIFSMLAALGALLNFLRRVPVSVAGPFAWFFGYIGDSVRLLSCTFVTILSWVMCFRDCCCNMILSWVIPSCYTKVARIITRTFYWHGFRYSEAISLRSPRLPSPSSILFMEFWLYISQQSQTDCLCRAFRLCSGHLCWNYTGDWDKSSRYCYGLLVGCSIFFSYTLLLGFRKYKILWLHDSTGFRTRQGIFALPVEVYCSLASVLLVNCLDGSLCLLILFSGCSIFSSWCLQAWQAFCPQSSPRLAILIF